MENKFEVAFVTLKHYLIQQINLCGQIYNKLYLEDDVDKREQCHSWRHARDELRDILDFSERLEIKYELDKKNDNG